MERHKMRAHLPIGMHSWAPKSFNLEAHFPGKSLVRALRTNEKLACSFSHSVRSKKAQKSFSILSQHFLIMVSLFICGCWPNHFMNVHSTTHKDCSMLHPIISGCVVVFFDKPLIDSYRLSQAKKCQCADGTQQSNGSVAASHYPFSVLTGRIRVLISEVNIRDANTTKQFAVPPSLVLNVFVHLCANSHAIKAE